MTSDRQLAKRGGEGWIDVAKRDSLSHRVYLVSQATPRRSQFHNLTLKREGCANKHWGVEGRLECEEAPQERTWSSRCGISFLLSGSGSEVVRFSPTKFSVRNLGLHREAMEKLATTDLCDDHMNEIAAGDIRILPPGFQIYGKRRNFSGSIVTTKVFEDNVLVRGLLEEQGDGKVLVVDGGGSLRCALLGGYLASIGQKNGWAAIIVNGCIRDTDEINDCDIGVRALASNPLKSNKKGEGDKNIPVVIGGVRIVPGEWCYADSDGIIVSRRKLSKL